MARVAANQDRTEIERTHYVLVQHAHVQSRKGKAVMCDEITDMRVTPSPKGQVQTLLMLSGHVRDGGRVVHYTAFPVSTSRPADGERAQAEEDQDVRVEVGDKETILDADANNTPVRVSGTDVDMVENKRRNFTLNTKSKDGVNSGLFPLTTKEQKDMSFELTGRELKNGRDTFHIAFRPKDNSEIGWKGEAWIDTQVFEPVVVRTALSRSLPLGVRLLLGTNVPGLGFSVSYAPQGDVWFPASFGTEFKVRVLFAFRREIVIDVVNRAFERTHVTTNVHADEAQPVTSSSEGAAPKP